MRRIKDTLIESPPELAGFHGRFNRLNPKLKEYRIVGWDTEDDTRGTPLSFAFYDGQEHFYTTSADEAIDYVFNYPNIAVFCAHNLEYDIGNLFKHCAFDYIDEMVYASRLLKATIKGSKNYFLNSGSFFMGPLSKMGALVGVKKVDGDVFNPEYVKTDAKIVYVFMDKFQSALLQKSGVNLGVSIGQLSMMDYRTNFMTRKTQITYNSPNCLKAYYGGRVEMFYKGVVTEKITVADINSAYPFAMRSNRYPDTSKLEHSSIETHEFGIGKFTVHVPKDTFIPVLPWKNRSEKDEEISGRLFFPIGTFTGWWTYAEVRYAVECGAQIVAELDGEGTNAACDPFTGFIDTHYGERLQWKIKKKANENDVDANFYDMYEKLFQNNLYGKWCQHKPQAMMRRTRLSPREREKLGDYKEVMVGPFFSYTVERDKPPRTANYLWGVYVTSYARIHLHKQLKAVHESGARLIYCDTDSIMFSGECDSLDYGSALGQLDKEEFDSGVFRQAKGYLLCKHRASDLETRRPVHFVEKVACKGVPTFEALDFVVKGISKLFRKPMRLKEAEIRLNAEVNKDKDEAFFKDVGINVWKEVRKEMKSVYIKRKGERGVTRPVDVLEIPALEETCKGEVISIENEVDAAGIELLNTKKANTAFQNIVVPKDWFGSKREQEASRKYYESQRLHWFKREECYGYKAGSVWFAGEIQAVDQGKFGQYVRVLINEYLGKSVRSKNMTGALSVKFLNKNTDLKKIVGKHLVISLHSDYIKNQQLRLNVSLENADGTGRYRFAAKKSHAFK